MRAGQPLASVEELRGFLERRGPFDVCAWDFDGVICDSEPWQAQAYEVVLQRHGIQPPPDFFVGCVGLTEPEIWGRLIAEHGLRSPLAELIAARLEVLRPTLLREARPNWFVRPAVAALAAAGTRSVVVSSGDPGLIRPYLAAWDLAPAFGSISAHGPDAGPKKDRLLATLASATRTLVVEDVEHYVAVAADAGAVTIGVVHGLNAGTLRSADALVGARPEDPG